MSYVETEKYKNQNLLKFEVENGQRKQQANA